MTLAELKPSSKQLVFDLVTRAGVDTSDWKNYERPDIPAANPKYCYDWAFWDVSRKTVVLCLWYSQMGETDGEISQSLNYRELASVSSHRDPSVGVRAKRARRMDQAFFMAWSRKLPVRVIVVDGPRRGVDGADVSEVERRMLDPVEWRVLSYDEDSGACKIVRRTSPADSIELARTFLLTWSSDQTPDSEIADIATQLEAGEEAEGQWSSGSRKDMVLGERVFLIRQGTDAPGLIGWGVINKEPFTERHWDAEKRKKGIEANYIMVDWRGMVPKAAGIPRSVLLKNGVPESLVNAQGSGVKIPQDVVEILLNLWNDKNRSAARATDQSDKSGSGVENNKMLARIAYNSTGWQRPTGEAGDHESGETYNARNKFGHEDWLFRAEWVIDGWRYAFIQGLNKHRLAYVGQSLDVTLYTLQPDQRRRLVGTITGLESLSDQQAKDALDAFKARGWLKIMQEEVKAIGGNADALSDPKREEHVLNVRYRQENVDPYLDEIFLADDDWIRNRHRYTLYKFDWKEKERVEKSAAGRTGSLDAPDARRLFRRGTKPLEYTPEHDKMQAKLMAELQKEFGRENVVREQDFVDVRVETEKELIYFEIKTDLDPRAVIRQALGQILEYAYHPIRDGRRPDSLVIVGRTALGAKDTAYLNRLCEEFTIPLSYRVVTL